WNASWHTGEGTGVGYIANAAVMDGLARDGDAARPGNQPFTLVFSAGNAGGAPSTITSPKEAKNIILIASSQNARASYVGAKGRPDRISGFSSRGPARDGRIGITVTAPGENVVSARARMGALCTTDPPLDAGAPFYSLCSGTSMAAPHATGAVALLTEQWRAQHGGTSPSPAMAKALLVNTAQDIGERDIPNGNEGWGRIDLAALLDRAAKRVTVDQSVRLDRVGQSYGLRVAPVDPRRPMKVTLVWTDAPGKPQAPTTRTGKNNKPALVNDLDLTLVGGEGTYRGNRFIDGVSVVGGARDRLENVENVFVQRPSPRGYDLRIRATALPGDGVPGVGNRNDQDFALVLSNARLVR
ncbi:MAG TPA: S8 family serine peptidase, partial [Mycobacteriales bacterium]|nr:S8 family serine peptidase [Mycobacteriales bacterium]